MRKSIFVIILVLIFSVIAITSYAQTNNKNETDVTVDLTKLSSTARNEILNIKSEKGIEKAPTQEVAKGWINIGKEIGSAVNEMAKALNTNINEFAKTPVGRTAMFLLIYKLIGKDLIGKGMTILIYVFSVTLLIWSFRKFHVNERIETIINKDSKVKSVEYIPRFNFRSSDAKTASACFHVGIFFILTIITIIIIC